MYNNEPLVFPHITEKDLIIDEDLLQLDNLIGGIPEELIALDPKVAYLISK